MSITAAALRELHRIHQQLAEQRDRLERGPRQVRAREGSVAQLEARLAEAREKAKQTQMTVDRKQLDLKSGEQKVVDLRVKLNAANSNREYQTLLEQIAAAEMAGSVLSDEILEGLEKIDQHGAAVKEAEKNRATGKQELDKARKAVEQSAATIHADVTRLEGELIEAEKALPSDLKSDYQRVVKSKGADSLAASEDGVCTGCGQQITLNMQNELKLSKLVFCKACGRLLYLPEDDAPSPPQPKRYASGRMEDLVDFRRYVQSGRPKSVQDILSKYGNWSELKRTLGKRFRAKNWEVRGFTANPMDVEEKSDEADMRIGEAIITKHINGIIETPNPWESDMLKAVKDGICTGCRHAVTPEMQNQLKLSLPVRCKSCDRMLFGPGE